MTQYISKYFSKYVFFITLVMFVAIFTGSNNLFAQVDHNEIGRKKALEALTHNTNSMGRYFMLALPPNEVKNYPAQVAAIYVAASEVTKVQLTSPLGTVITKTCQPYSTVSFTSLNPKDQFSWDSEVWESEVVVNKAWTIKTDKPVSVYVLNSKVYTADGYLAIAVADWGKDYIHCAFWDYPESTKWAGGFLVMAAEDNTKIKIKLNGQGKGVAQTRQGHNIGDQWTVTLMKGEVYSVQGDGTSRGFDLTGSRVTSDKPIGMISFHHRCIIPSYTVTNGRDALNEFMPPVQTWGKKYITVELKRNTNMGDYFRVVAKEDMTNITLKWYDKDTKKMVSQTDVTLKKAGDFYEFYNTAATWPHNFPSVRGTSVWEGDKPFLLLQYSYSANWDGSDDYDPFMFLVTPTEQYTKSTIFQTPQNETGNEYTYNLFNIVAIGDTVDQKRNFELLNSIKLDGERMSDKEPSFLLNQIPGTDQFWAQIRVNPGPHYIEGETPFGGYIYGFASFDSYAWPAATAYRKVGELDTLPPVPTPVGECGVYEVQVTELRNGEETDNPRQVERGVGQEPTFSKNSYNFSPITYEVPTWVPYPTQFDFKFFTSVVDKYADAYAEIRLVDDANNDTLCILRYEADSIKINPELIDFKEVRVGTTSNELIVTLESHSDSLITIKDLKLKKGQVFKIIKGLDKDKTGKMFLLPRESKEITMVYTPKQEFNDVIPDKMDIDSLLIETNCLKFSAPVIGKGVIPKIRVSDFNAGIVGVNQKRCVTSLSEGIVVENIGSMDLIVTGIDLTPTEQLPFVMSDQATINVKFPFTLKPSEKVALKEVCFEPKVSDLGQGKITRNVKFISNAGGNLPNEKPISVWEGTPVQPLVTVTGLDYPTVRRLSVNKANGVDNETKVATGIVRVYNSGTQVVKITSIKLGNLNPGNYVIDYKNMKPRDISQAGTTIDLHPISASGNLTKMIEVPVTFNPQIVGQVNEEIIAEFDDNGNASQAGNVLTGFAFEPKIELTNYTFAKNTIVGRDHKETDGTITKGVVKIENVTNNGVEANLEISGLTPMGDVTDFTLQNTPNYPLIIKPNGSYDLEYTFKPTAVGDRKIQLTVLSDAGPSKENIGGARDPKDYLYSGPNGVVSGVGINVGGGVVGFDLAYVLTCDNPVGTVTFTNTSTTDVLKINSITPDVSSDLTSFEALDPLPTVIPINSQVTVRYRYLANKLGKVIARFAVDFDDPEVLDQDYTLEAFGYEHKVSFDLDDYTTDVKLGATINPYPVKIKLQTTPNAYGIKDDWADAGIKKFSVDFRYKSTWLQVAKDVSGNFMISKGDALQGNWKLSGTVLIDQKDMDYSIFRITGENLDKGIVNGNGSLVNLGIRVFLADTSSYRPEIDIRNISFIGLDNQERNKCIIAEGGDGQIAYTTCVQNLRGVLIGGNFSLSGPSQQVISTDNIEVKFEVPFQVPTKLEVVDITGSIISTPFDSVLQAGVYQANISTQSLSSGQYFVRLSAGPYSETVKFILAK